MKTRHLGKALVGLVVTATAVGLMGLPAPADTADTDLNTGTLDIYASDSSLYSTSSMGTGGSTQRPNSSNSGTIIIGATTTSTGTFTETANSHRYGTIGTSTFTSKWTITLSATISSNGAITAGTGSSTILLWNSICSTTGGVACTISVSGITFTGTSTMVGHVIDPSDTVTLSGTTGEHGGFTFHVSISGTNCGGLTALDDGSFVFTNWVFHALT